MDPVSIVMLTNASFAIARSLVHTIKELYELAEAYETAALGIRTVATQCNSFRVAVQRINTWLTQQDESAKHNLDDDFWQALADNLETGRLVLEDLEKRISGMKKSPAKFWTRTKYLWNSVVISELQSQIQGLMSALGILIQVIDIPTPAGKRSQSLAQRSRLNNLTKSVRLTVDQRRERIRQTQEQSLLDDVDAEPVPSGLQEPLPVLGAGTGAPATPSGTGPGSAASPHVNARSQLSQQQFVPSSTADAPPPPYDYYGDALKQTRSESKAAPNDTKKGSDIVVTEKDSSFRVLDTSEAGEDKSKRFKWNLKFKKRSKDQSTPPGSSGSQDDGSKAKSQSETPVPVKILDSASHTHYQHTPAAIDDSKGGEEYFDLQRAMMGMSMPDDLAGSPGVASHQPKVRNEGQEPTSAKARSGSGDVLSKIPSITTPPEEKSTNAFASSIDSDLALSSNASPPVPSQRVARSTSDIDFGTASASAVPPTRASTSNTTYATIKPTNFDSIRPSQRVRQTRERSRSRGPSHGDDDDNETTPPPSQTSSRPKPTTGLSFSPQTIHQTWRTTPSQTTSTSLSTSNSSTLRLKISYTPTSFTSRISTSAARSLGLLDTALTNTIDNIPIATLTLLYTVSDGETQSVMGDEVELEVMHEEEARGVQIRFGAEQLHLKELMEVQEALYWSERGVPPSLRTTDRLRMLRRFEMVMW